MSARWSRRCRTPAISTSGRSPPRPPAEQALARGDVMFVLNIPPDFSRRIDRGEKPQVLMDADATDPTAIANATAAVVALNATVLNRDLPVAMRAQPAEPPFQIVLHARYNPEQITALNIVPGLIGLILTVFDACHDLACHHARARDGHHGEPAGHAGAARSRSCSARSSPMSGSPMCRRR